MAPGVVGHEHPEDHVALGRAATRAAPNSIFRLWSEDDTPVFVSSPGQ